VVSSASWSWLFLAFSSSTMEARVSLSIHHRLWRWRPGSARDPKDSDRRSSWWRQDNSSSQAQRLDWFHGTCYWPILLARQEYRSSPYLPGMFLRYFFFLSHSVWIWLILICFVAFQYNWFQHDSRIETECLNSCFFLFYSLFCILILIFLCDQAKQKQIGVERMMLPSVQGEEDGKWIVIDSGTSWFFLSIHFVEFE